MICSVERTIVLLNFVLGFLLFHCEPVSSFITASKKPLQHSSLLQSQRLHTRHAQNKITTTGLRVVADSPTLDDEKRKRENRTEDANSDWIEAESGGFIPNLSSRLRSVLHRNEKPTQPPTAPPKASPASQTRIQQVLNIEEYKTEVVDVQDQMVCVRFYAPWCKACKAVEGSFRRMSREFPDIKFVEVPVTKENAFLHKGLGVPSLPFGHIYDPSVGLVEERKLNKNVFEEFRGILQTYSNGECPVTYDVSKVSF